ncbi:hypothetical protein PACTADRAFT_59245 [Pachysolen tannophilus NRRL Y-2460]|uniref:D-lactate dehydratase n=1 Tax=Pachysolen tannophilus NRRL Y-2460 TaxID=669874 RepID=A0A1E4TSU8_PACTA|nr:hypothetical protein PACTADRAFT_59245 [Pachysolen tannophilus NRRL Y-2460]
MSGLPKKVLLAVTSSSEPFYENGDKTGVFYSEVSHPYKVFKEKGYDVDIVSETGSTSVDEHSISSMYLNSEELEGYKNYTDKYNIRKLLETACKPSKNVSSSDYGIFFAAGGHGAVFDFPNAKGLHKLASEIYDKGGVVAAVCHGPVIFDNLLKSNGTPLIEGIKVTGFTDEGEKLAGVDGSLKKLNLHTVKYIASKNKGIYQEPPAPFDDYSIVDNRIVTGVNPASATSCATKTCATFESHN